MSERGQRRVRFGDAGEDRSRGSKRVADETSNRPSAIVASAIALELRRTNSLAGRLNAEPERPHSPAQLQPRAEVP